MPDSRSMLAQRWAVAFASAALGLVMALGLAGCRYSAGPTYDERVRTVAVPLFENRTFYRGIELQLTEAIAKQIEATTPYKIARERAADSVLTGEIVNVRQSVLSKTDVGGLPQESELAITIDFRWRNANTGDLLVERKGMTAVGRFVSSIPVGEPMAVGQIEAVERSADMVVRSMRGQW